MALPATFSMKSAKGTTPVPTVGFGTWASGDNSWCYNATLAALQAGYRHLDCAWYYGVDDQIGAAIRASGVTRNEIFITSKFWPHFGAPENVEKCLDLVLQNMGLDYLDLFLAHWPVVFRALPHIAAAKSGPNASDVDKAIPTGSDGKPIVDWEHSCASIAASSGHKGSFLPTWRSLQSLVSTNKVRAVGVSNFNIQQLEEVLNAGGDVPVSCNQIEAHPWLPNSELLAFMRENGVLGTVYSPFGGKQAGSLLGDPVVKRVATKNGLGEGQLLQSWAVQRGTVPLGKSQTPARIKTNLDVQKLLDEDIEALNALDKGPSGRTVDFSERWGVRFY